MDNLLFRLFDERWSFMLAPWGRRTIALPQLGGMLVDWKYLYLDPKGRIGQKDFWIGFAILFAAGLVLGMIPVLGMIISIVLIYPWVCLYAKRLHDFGKTGWLMLIPVAVGIAAAILGVVFGGMSLFAAGMNGADYRDAAVAGSMMAGMGAMFGFLALACLVGLIFLLWVGLSKGDAGANQYGEPRATPAVNF